MKKIRIIFMLLPFYMSAQTPADSVPPMVKDTAWKVHGFFGINTSQTTLSNWQGGGENNFNLGAIVNFDATYKRDQFEQWINKLDAQFGAIIVPGSEVLRKNLDQLFVLSKYNTKAFGKHWFWAIQADYRTQFAPGYSHTGDSISARPVSNFNSPGYLQLALGLDYKPADYFSLGFLPVAGKMTMVNQQYLADDGAFGVTPAIRDTAGRIITPGKRVRYEAGARIVMKFKKDIIKNVNLDSYLDLFSNYLEDFGNVDVVFNNLLTAKIGRFFTFNVISQVMYDDDVITKKDFDQDGKYETPGDINGPRLMTLTTIAIGFGYKF